MKLDDFDEKCPGYAITNFGDFSKEPIRFPVMLRKEDVKKYVADKLREFGEKLKEWVDNEDLVGLVEGDANSHFYIQVSKLNAQIDKELKELE